MAKKKDDIWWPRYVGDYQRKTQHLSLSEHGAYVLLLDYYYSSGRPPANAVQLHRICRAFVPDEQAAVQVIVTTFFTEQDGYLVNDRAEDEILRRSNVSEKRSEAARIKHAKAGAIADANAHTVTVTVTDTVKSKRVVGSRLPAEWTLPDEWRFYAASQGFSDAVYRHEADKFRDYWIAQPGQKGVKLDWFATWRNWLRNARPGTHTGAKTSTEPPRKQFNIADYADEVTP